MAALEGRKTISILTHHTWTTGRPSSLLVSPVPLPDPVILYHSQKLLQGPSYDSALNTSMNCLLLSVHQPYEIGTIIIPIYRNRN